MGGWMLKTVGVHARMPGHCSMPCALLGGSGQETFKFGFSEIAIWKIKSVMYIIGGGTYLKVGGPQKKCTDNAANKYSLWKL